MEPMNIIVQKRNPYEQVYMTSAQVCARYSITEMTLWRWSKAARLQFPKPMKISRRNYYKVTDIERWEAERSGE